MIYFAAQLESFENFNLSTQIGINMFKNKGSMKEDARFTNPYRRSKSNENQNLEVSETVLV